MIVCAPDMTVDIATRLGVEPCVLVVVNNRHPVSKLKILLDVGIAGAKRGVNAAIYITSARRIKPTWAVVPDVFGDFRRTLAQWLRYAPIISRHAAPIFVAQEFYRPSILDVLLHDLRQLGVVKVALPMRQHPDVSCASEPRLCAERAERALRWLCGSVEHIHLLGPALKSVKMLRGVLHQCERQDTVVSFDTSAYRRAPNQQIKRQLGGRWMPRSHEEAVAMLETWLRQALAL